MTEDIVDLSEDISELWDFLCCIKKFVGIIA